jgi:hypothetical protein
MMLENLLKDSAYKLTQFSDAHISTLETSIINRDLRGKLTPYMLWLPQTTAL